MGFSHGFSKVAFIAPLAAAAARGIGKGLLGAGKLVGKGLAGAGGLASRAAGGPLNLAFTAMDAQNQFKQNMGALKQSYRG